VALIMTSRRDDRETRGRIVQELEARGLDGIRVRVDSRGVTISGTVDSYAKQLEARDAAHRGAGRAELTDNIQVRLPGSTARTDAEVEGAVTRALEFDAFVPRGRVTVAVRRGSVSLEGEVETLLERDDVLRVVRHVSGVRAIQNRIRVRGFAVEFRPSRRSLPKET